MDHAGQNVRLLCNQFEDWGGSLRAGGQYDHALTRTMIKNVLKSTDLPAPYTWKLSTLQNKLDEALAESTYMSPSERWDYMAKKELTFEDVCEVMASAYDVLAINNEWPAAKLPSDSAKIPSKFAHLSRHLFNLMQSESSDKKKVICYNCGEEGHYSNRCPNPKKGKGDGKVKAKSWKVVPPGKGESTTKKVKGKPLTGVQSVRGGLQPTLPLLILESLLIKEIISLHPQVFWSMIPRFGVCLILSTKELLLVK